MTHSTRKGVLLHVRVSVAVVRFASLAVPRALARGQLLLEPRAFALEHVALLVELRQLLQGVQDRLARSLGQLARHLSKIGGIDRIRYTTSHPRDMDDDLIAAHAEVPELMPFLHLPVQSGSDRILKAMNRGHTAEHYLDIMRQMREARPGCHFCDRFPP